MFYFKDQDNEYQVKFVHEKKLFIHFLKNKKYETFEHYKPYKTICLLIDVKTNELKYKGVAECSEQDQFCYKIGRKLALDRAINSFDKATKQVIWTTFFGMSKSKY